jgi:hypothetical protein
MHHVPEVFWLRRLLSTQEQSKHQETIFRSLYKVQLHLPALLDPACPLANPNADAGLHGQGALQLLDPSQGSSADCKAALALCTATVTACVASASMCKSSQVAPYALILACSSLCCA